MKYDKLLPFLSDSLEHLLDDLIEKHEKCEIAKELIRANKLINLYNRTCTAYIYSDSEIELLLTTLKKEIDSILTDEARMLTFRFNVFEISYLPKDKTPIYTADNKWSRENRQAAKPARIIQKVLVNKYECRDFENFSNWIKAEIINTNQFEIVSGKDITTYYNYETYYEDKGTIGNSCMRYNSCQNFFGLYEDHAKMLVSKKDDLITGRAILWEIDGKTYMDRIYTCYDYLEDQFIAYAKMNNFYIRESNCLLHDGDYQQWCGPEDDYVHGNTIDLTIKLSKEYDYFPYVDSFRYYDNINNTIHTNPKYAKYCLSNTDGDVGSKVETITCACCGETMINFEDDDLPEDWIYSSYCDEILCPDCYTYCDGIDDYVNINTVELVDVQFDNYTKRYPLKYVEQDSDFVYIDDQWYDLEYKYVAIDEQGVYYIDK